MATIKKACKGVSYPKSSSVSKRLGSPSKAKNGKSFPDLNKDGKITKADVLKGRGVIAKKGMKVKKAQNGTTSKKEDRQARNIKTAKQRFDASTNPPYNRDKVDFPVKGVTLRQNVDTSGYAAGRKFFPYKNQLESSEGGPRVEKKPRYGVASRRLIDIAFANDKKKSAPKNKMGGKTKKCAYGCK
jgi:hypothetical protein